MKKILIYCVIAFSFWSCKSEMHNGAMLPERGFHSDRPAKIWEESLVSGNGIMGAMVMGDPYQESIVLTYIIHSGFISGYQNRYGDNLKPPTNVYHRMTA